MSPKFKEGQIVLDHVNGRLVEITKVLPRTPMPVETQWYDVRDLPPVPKGAFNSILDYIGAIGSHGMPESCLTEVTDLARTLYAQDHHDS